MARRRGPGTPGDGETASHAEADDPDACRIDLRLGDQEVRGALRWGPLLLAADHRLAHQACQADHPAAVVEEVDGERCIALRREAPVMSRCCR